MNLVGIFRRTASTTLSVGNITADATRPRRIEWYDVTVGSEAAAADNPFLWVFQRCTTAGTATALTLNPTDPADAATEQDAGVNHTVDPTYTANLIMLDIPLNQRSTFRWIATEGGRIITPATASNGLGISTPTSSALAVTATIHVNER
jgi:hypothetical protein